jgi:hypothetical protein
MNLHRLLNIKLNPIAMIIFYTSAFMQGSNLIGVGLCALVYSFSRSMKKEHDRR